MSPPVFTPGGGGDETCTISAGIADQAGPVTGDWALTIRNAAGSPVRTVEGTGTSIEFIWDGTGDASEALPAGWYEVLLDADVQPSGQGVVSASTYRTTVEIGG